MVICKTHHRAFKSFLTLCLAFICSTLLFGCSTGSTVEYSFDNNKTERHYSFDTNSGSQYDTTWIESEAPNYYKVLGACEESYDPQIDVIIEGLDNLERTQSVEAIVTYDMVKESAGWREQFGKNNNPSGWPQKNSETTIELPNGKTYNGWFWNRSHLLADSLGGHAVKENAITGTRMQNVGSNDSKNPGGMAYIETKVRNFIYDHPTEVVYYKATPIYNTDELIPRAVIVNAESSDGTIDETVMVYNTAKGFDINYYTGEINKN